MSENFREAHIDARQRRTQTSLHAAVLALAESTPASVLSVTEVAERAGVHRSTFYEHAASASDLLANALRGDLDDARARYLEDVPEAGLPDALHEVTRAVLHHIRDHAPVYRTGLAAGGTLHAFLSDHFQQSSRLLLAQHLVVPIPGDDRMLIEDAAIRFVAEGTVGAITAWLADDPTPDPERFLEIYEPLLPAWWPRAG